MSTPKNSKMWQAPEHQQFHGHSNIGVIMENAALAYNDEDFIRLDTDGNVLIEDEEATEDEEAIVQLFANGDLGLEEARQYIPLERYDEEFPEELGICPLLGHKRVFWERLEIPEFWDGKPIIKWERHDFRDEAVIGNRDEDRWQSHWDSPLMDEITVITKDDWGNWFPSGDWGLLPSSDREDEALVVNEIVDEIQDSSLSPVRKHQRDLEKLAAIALAENKARERFLAREQQQTQAILRRHEALERRSKNWK